MLVSQSASSSKSSKHHNCQTVRARKLKCWENVHPCHMSCITCHLSIVIRHLSHVTCHLTPVTCHLSHVKRNIWKKKKMQIHPYLPAVWWGPDQGGVGKDGPGDLGVRTCLCWGSVTKQQTFWGPAADILLSLSHCGAGNLQALQRRPLKCNYDWCLEKCRGLVEHIKRLETSRKLLTAGWNN